MYAKKWLDHVWESFSKIMCVCVLSFGSVLVLITVFWMNGLLHHYQPQPTWWLDWNFLPRMSLQTYEYIWCILIYIDLSYAVTSFPHNIYSCNTYIQHFSKTSRNVAGHSRAGTLEGASWQAFKLLRLHPRKLTWRPKIAIFERRYIFQIIILCIYLDFRRCMQTKASLGSHIWDCITVKFQPSKMFMKCMKVKRCPVVFEPEATIKICVVICYDVMTTVLEGDWSLWVVQVLISPWNLFSFPAEFLCILAR